MTTPSTSTTTIIEGALRSQLTALAAGETLSDAAMAEALDHIFDGVVSDIEIAGFLMALRARGEHPTEIAAAARVMRARAAPVETGLDVVDTCGTGGDGANTVNISTAAAIIAAAAGAAVAKHGNRAMSSKSGSSDVLAALGVNLDADPQQIAKCVQTAGVGFMFAPRHHGAAARVAPVRKALGVRTLFNLLGPLTNPAGAQRQVIGVFDPTFLEPLAEALSALGSTRAWIVHGGDGLDELTVTGPSFVAALDKGAVTRFEVTPEDAGLARHPIESLRGGDPAENAERMKEVLAGRQGAYRDVALLNAAAALVVADKAASLRDGAQLAASAIDDGRAAETLKQLVAVSNAPA
ncbi:MAG: anthranilate phosphoribosyltransferase [Pseudomonadota bacterium]